MREVLPLFLLELMNEDPKVCGRQESRRILIGNYVRKHHACFLFPGPPRGEWSLVFSSGSAAWRMVSGGFFFPGPPRGEWSLVLQVRRVENGLWWFFFSGFASWRMVSGVFLRVRLVENGLWCFFLGPPRGEWSPGGVCTHSSSGYSAMITIVWKHSGWLETGWQFC